MEYRWVVGGKVETGVRRSRPDRNLEAAGGDVAVLEEAVPLASRE
jgi:hypothetical protein